MAERTRAARGPEAAGIAADWAGGARARWRLRGEVSVAPGRRGGPGGPWRGPRLGGGTLGRGGGGRPGGGWRSAALASRAMGRCGSSGAPPPAGVRPPRPRPRPARGCPGARGSVPLRGWRVFGPTLWVTGAAGSPGAPACGLGPAPCVTCGGTRGPAFPRGSAAKASRAASGGQGVAGPTQEEGHPVAVASSLVSRKAVLGAVASPWPESWSRPGRVSTVHVSETLVCVEQAGRVLNAPPPP